MQGVRDALEIWARAEELDADGFVLCLACFNLSGAAHIHLTYGGARLFGLC